MARIFLTGATGTLGAILARNLIVRGHDLVCLVRASDRQAARARLGRIAEDMDVVCGDIHLPACGLSNEHLVDLGQFDLLLHCAASIDFLDADRAAQSNINGLRHVLDIATLMGVGRFHHVSTAYVAGDAPFFSEDDHDVGQGFRNPYENSKFIGETLVRDWALSQGVPAAIFRPSILVGGADGTIRSFDAFYTYLKPLALTAASMRRRGATLPAGFHVGAGGEVYLPLAVHLKRAATLNVVPVDWVAARIADLVDMSSTAGTYHLVHPQPPRVGWLFEASMRALRISGVQIVESADDKAALVARLPPVHARLQRNIDRVLAAYLPYTLGEARFDGLRLRKALGTALVAPAAINETYIARLLDHAESRGWGSPLDASTPVVRAA